MMMSTDEEAQGQCVDVAASLAREACSVLENPRQMVKKSKMVKDVLGMALMILPKLAGQWQKHADLMVEMETVLTAVLEILRKFHLRGTFGRMAVRFQYKKDLEGRLNDGVEFVYDKLLNVLLWETGKSNPEYDELAQQLSSTWDAKEREDCDREDFEIDWGNLLDKMKQCSEGNPKARSFLENYKDMRIGEVAVELRKPSSKMRSQLFNVAVFNRADATQSPRNTEIDKTFQLFKDEMIGFGSFCEVYRGRWGKDEVAVKRSHARFPSVAYFEFQEELQQEGKKWRDLSHNNVAKIHGVVFLETEMVLLMEMCQCPLNYLLHESQREISSEAVNKILKGIASGLEYLHANNIVHRDLQPSNVMLSQDLRYVKLLDFGLSALKQASIAPQGSTIRYMAPETLKASSNPKWTSRSDIYSFGILCWEVLHRKIPWGAGSGSVPEIRERVLRGERPFMNLSLNIKPRLIYIIKSCWAQEVKRRPFASAVVQDFSKQSKRRSTIVVKGLLSFLKPMLARQGLGEEGSTPTESRRGSLTITRSSLDRSLGRKKSPQKGMIELDSSSKSGRRKHSSLRVDSKQTENAVKAAVEELKEEQSFESGLDTLMKIIKSRADLAPQASDQVKLVRKKALEAGVLDILLESLKKSQQKAPFINARILQAVGYVLQVDRETFSFDVQLEQLETLLAVLEATIEQMQKREDDALVQQWGCFAMSSLASCQVIAGELFFERGVVRVLLLAIDNHIFVPDLLRYSCNTFRLLTIVDTKSRLALIAAGVPQRVQAIMDSHLANAELFKSCLTVIRNLCLEKEGREALKYLNLGNHILAGMEANQDDPTLLQYGCGAMCNLALTEANGDALLNLGAVESVLAAMQQFPTNSRLQENACNLFWILGGSSEERKLQILKDKAGEQLIRVIKDLPLDIRVIKKAFGALSSFTAVRSYLANWNGFGTGVAILESMRAHSESLAIQQYGCEILFNLADRLADRPKLMEAGAPESVLRAMRRHPTDPIVQNKASMFLGRIAEDAPNQGPLLRLGAADSLLSVLRTHGDNTKVLTSACVALWTISTAAENKQPLMRVGTCRIILNLMKEHPVLGDLQQLCCAILWNLALDPNCVPILQQCGSTVEVLNTMQTNMAHEKVQVKAMGFLAAMAQNHEALRILMKERAYSLAIEASLMHRKNPILHEKACSLFGKLASEESDALELIDSEVLHTIGGSMQLHRLDPFVQEKACVALLAFSHHAPCRPMLIEEELHVLAVQVLEIHFEKGSAVKAALRFLARLAPFEQSAIATLVNHHSLEKKLEKIQDMHESKNEIQALVSHLLEIAAVAEE